MQTRVSTGLHFIFVKNLDDDDKVERASSDQARDANFCSVLSFSTPPCTSWKKSLSLQQPLNKISNIIAIIAIIIVIIVIVIFNITILLLLTTITTALAIISIFNNKSIFTCKTPPRQDCRHRSHQALGISVLLALLPFL